MAVIRLTKELKDAIVRSAHGIFRTQWEVANASYPQDWGTRVYERVFAAYTPAMNTLPLGFFTMVENLGISQIGDLRVGVTCPLPHPVPYPAHLPTTKDFPLLKSYPYANVILKDIPMFADIKQEAMDYLARKQAVDERRTAFAAQVGGILDAHTTLAPALKMWPPLWDLLSEESKERSREVVTRTKAVKVTVDADFGALTATVVAHKLTR